MERRKYPSISEVVTVARTGKGVTVTYREPFSIPGDEFCMSLGRLRAVLPIDCRGSVAKEVTGALNEEGILNPARLSPRLANLVIAFSEYTRDLSAINGTLTDNGTLTEIPDTSNALSLKDLMALETRGAGVGLVLRRLRHDFGLSQSDIGKRMGYGPSQISSVE